MSKEATLSCTKVNILGARVPIIFLCQEKIYKATDKNENSREIKGTITITEDGKTTSTIGNRTIE